MPGVMMEWGRLFYARGGGGAPPLVCLHGAGGSHQHWGWQLQALGDLVRVIAPDLPGHGRSAGHGYADIAAYGRALVAILDALDVERAILAGHSMGGAIALWIALHNPERVAGLALIATGARLRVAPAFLTGLQETPAATISDMVPYLYGPAAAPELRAAGETAFHASDPTVFHADFVACDRFDLRDQLAQIAAPALVVCGEQDQMTPPKYSRYLAEQLANAELALVPDAGHMVMLECPDVVNAALRRFVTFISQYKTD